MRQSASGAAPAGVRLVAVAVLLCACSLAGAPPTAQPAPATPSPAASKVPTPTLGPTATPAALPTGAETDDAQAAPPLGVIRLAGGSVVTGSQGSWCFDQGCLDGGPIRLDSLPSLALPGPAAELEFELPATHPFTYWEAAYSTGTEDAELMTLASGGVEYDPDLSTHTPGPDLSTFTFAGPPSGEWRLDVDLQFGDNRGSTVYHWRAVVP